MNRKKLYASLLITPLAFTLTACGTGGQVSNKNPEEVVKEMFENFAEVKAMSADIESSMNFETPDGTFDLSLDINGKFDELEAGNSKVDFSLIIDGKIDSEQTQEDGLLNISFRGVDQNAYLKINEYKIPTFFAIYALLIQDTLEEYKNKWVSIPAQFIPPELQAQLLQSDDQKTQEALDAEEKMKNLLVEKPIIEVVEDHGIKDVNGVSTHHYDVKIHNENFKNFIIESNKINNSELPQAELDLTLEEIDKLDSVASIWIGTEDALPYKFSTEIQNNDEQQNVEYTIEVLAEMSNMNQPQDISAPSESVTLDEVMQAIQAPLGGVSGVESPQGIAPGEPNPTEDITQPTQ